MTVTWRRGEAPVVNTVAAQPTTDSLGNYYVCNVPLDQSIALTATAGTGRTGTLDVRLGARGILRQDMLVPLDNARRIGAAIVGHVIDVTGLGVRDAQGILDDADTALATDDRGRFIMRNLPLGSHMLTVRAIGYGTIRQIVQLRQDDTVRLGVRIERLTILDTIRVLGGGNRIVSDLVDRLRTGNAYSLAGDRLTRASYVNSALATLPMLYVSGVSALRGCQRGNKDDENSQSCARLYGGDVTRIEVSPTGARNGSAACRVHVWVDGHLEDEATMMAIPPRDLLAIEWYPRGNFVPAQYQATDYCGVLLVWTKHVR